MNDNDLIWFCCKCFAGEDAASWGEVLSEYCMNCGSGGTPIRIPAFAANSIRQQASWVGKRYYANSEDKEAAEELKALRALVPSFPGRTARQAPTFDPAETAHWQVSQRLPNGTCTSIFLPRLSGELSEDAIERSRYFLPYVPESALVSTKE